MAPTITDVAKRAGTTVATVSRVINNSGYVSAGMRAAVEAAVRDLGYVPNANARVLKTNRSRTLGVVVGDLLNPYAIELADSVRTVAAAHGYTTFIAAAAEDVASELSVIEAFHRQRVAGLVIATLPTSQSDEEIRRLVLHRMPVVLVGRSLEHEGVDSVSADFRRGGRLVTEHLLDLGHKRIAFIGADVGEADRVTRLRGYLDALAAAGLPVRTEYVVGNPLATGGPRYSTQATGYHGAHELLKLPSRPTAVFARNDHTAFGVIQALRERGYRVPEDFSVAGFDDVPLARQTIPALTTVSQPTVEQGRRAAEFLLGRIERPHERVEPRRVTLGCDLIVRGSTARPSKSTRAGADARAARDPD
jgi:DNA-binding LacI/PurR family transcriptional regulator